MNLKRSLALALSVMLILGVALPAALGADETLERIAGSNRWATAVEISQEGWTSAVTVVLANGRNYPDALAGVSLAYGQNAPILLTEADSLVAATKAEITRLGAGKVIILGGTGVISAAVEDAIKEMGLTVERIKGADRFETAANIAMQVAPAGVDTVVLASGRGYADALAAASYAAVKGYPILLTEKNSLPAATAKAIEDLGATNVIVVGGTGVIAEATVEDLPGVARVAGSNREATSVALAEHFNFQTNMYYLATGDGFADAITGAVLAAQEGTGILLVRGALAPVTSEFFANAQVVNAVIFGGTGVVSEAVAKAAADKLVPAGGTGVSGWVTNGAGATVSIGGVTGKVDNNEFYRIVGVAPGAHTMTITKTDFPTGQIAVKVVKDNISVLNPTLGSIAKANISIVGAVVDKATNASLDHTVSFDLWNAKDNKWEIGKASATLADGTGVFEFTNTAEVFNFGDQVRVNISVAGYHSVSRVITLAKYAEGNVLDGFELTAIKKMTLSGKVSAGTAALTGADVSLLDKDGEDIGIATVQTDAEGLYTFGKQVLATGTYTLRVVLADYATSSTLIAISEGVDKTQNVVMAPGFGVTFTLAPTAAVGEAFNAGDMTATLMRNNVAVAAPVPVATGGTTVTFAFPDKSIAPGTYTLQIAGVHVKTTNFAVTVVDKAVVAYGNADFAGTLSGTVNEGAKVELLNKAGAVIATQTAKTGSFAFSNLPAGDYKVRASLDGHITQTLKDAVKVEVNVTDSTTAITLVADPTTGAVTGTVREVGTLLPAYWIDPEGLAADVSATITYYALSNNIPNPATPGEPFKVGDEVQSTDIAADATYTFGAEFAPGSYTVVIRHEGFHETFITTQAIVAGDKLNKHYLVTPGGDASLAVKLTGDSDVALVGATVKLTDANGKVYILVPDGEGNYTFADLSGGTYTISITNDGYLDMEVPVTIVKGTDVARAFKLTPEGTALAVTVGVTGVDHAPLQDVVVQVFDADGKKVDVVIPVTGVDGKTSFDVEAGTYTVAFYLDGYFYAERTVTVGKEPIAMPVVVLTEW